MLVLTSNLFLDLFLYFVFTFLFVYITYFLAWMIKMDKLMKSIYEIIGISIIIILGGVLPILYIQNIDYKCQNYYKNNVSLSEINKKEPYSIFEKCIDIYEDNLETERKVTLIDEELIYKKYYNK